MVTQDIIPPGYEKWAAKLKAAAKAHRKSLWRIGDLLNEGDTRFGEIYTQAAEETGLARQTLINTKWCASVFGPDDRRETLSFSVHMEVGRLDPKHRQSILNLCERFGWGSKEVRQRITATKAGDKKALMPKWQPAEPIPFTNPKSTTQAVVPTGTGSENVTAEIYHQAAELVPLLKNIAPSHVLAELDGEEQENFQKLAEEMAWWFGGVSRAIQIEGEAHGEEERADPT